MTSRGRLWTALLAVGLAVGPTACADSTDDAGAPRSADVGPDRPGAGGEELVVDVLPLDAPLVLDPVPEGLELDHLSYTPPDAGDFPARATLYGDPDLADTLDGPVLLLGTTSDSATNTGPPAGAPGREVDLGGRTGRVVPDGERIWVLMDDYPEFLVGRGIGEDELVEAAHGADFTSATPTLAPDAVPAGLEPLVAGGPPDRPGIPGRGEELHLRGTSSRLSVYAVRADPRLAALWGFWTGDTTGTLVRGRPGSAGDLQGSDVSGSEVRGRIWAEDGLVLAIAGSDDELVDQAVENLRVGSWAEFEAMRRKILGRPPTPEDAGCTFHSGFVSGVQGDVRWAFALRPGQPGSGRWLTCYHEFATPGPGSASSAGGGSGGGEAIALPLVGELFAHDAWAGREPPLPGYALGYGIVGGVAPPGTARVTVTTPDGRTVEAQLSDVGPRPGERVWGTFIPQHAPPPPGSPPTTVTAYDAAGAILDSVPV